MRRPATRLLHVLFSVPVVIALVIAASPSARAQATAPAPLVIVIDPGHGGISDNAHPDMPYDPGAVAASNGLEEKNATLAVSKRLQGLLQADGVRAILTRGDDRWISIQERMDVANNNHAIVYVSVHFNSFTDSGPTGSLVLYPHDTDLAFAHSISDAMGRFLVPLGVPDDGIQLRDNWWVHAQMPTVTVEPAYLSNSHEAALVASPGFQQVLAMSLRSGIERFEPRVLQRKAEIAAWNLAHPDHPVTPAAATIATAGAAPQQGSAWLSTAIRDLLLASMVGAVIRWPRVAWRLVRLLVRVGQHGVEALLVKRAAKRRRRRAVSRRSVAMQAQRFARPHHIYDELF